MRRHAWAAAALMAGGWWAAATGPPTLSVPWTRLMEPIAGPLLWHRCHQALSLGRPREALAWAAQATAATVDSEPGRRFLAWICAWNLAEDAADTDTAAVWIWEAVMMLGPEQGREPATDEVEAVIWLDRGLGDPALTKLFGRDYAAERGREALERAAAAGSSGASLDELCAFLYELCVFLGEIRVFFM